MLSDSLFEVGCSLADAIKNYEEDYSVDVMQQLYDAWTILEKVRIRLDRYPGMPELSQGELGKCVQDSIAFYMKSTALETA